MRAYEEVQREFDAAFPHLFEVACHVVTRFFRYDITAVEDAVAETMARTLEGWERVCEHGNQGEWVVVCAKDVCLDRLRTYAKRRLPKQGADGTRRAVSLPQLTVISTKLWQALKALSKEERDVAVLLYLMDCDEVLTASALRAPLSEVRAAAHVARDRVRVFVGKVYPEVDEATA